MSALATRPSSLIPFVLLVLVALLWLAMVVPLGQLSLHPHYTHPDEITRVRSAFQDPRCKPGSPHYQEYWSESLQQYMFVCKDFNSGKTVVWFWYRSGALAEAREITGFMPRWAYVLRVVIRDGYVRIH